MGSIWPLTMVGTVMGALQNCYSDTVADTIMVHCDWYCYEGNVAGNGMELLWLVLLWEDCNQHCYRGTATGTVAGTTMGLLWLVLLWDNFDWHINWFTVTGNVLKAL